MSQATKEPTVQAQVDNPLTTTTTLPMEYFEGVGKFMFREPYHLFDESDLADIKAKAVSSGDAAIGGVDVHVLSDLPPFAQQRPTLVLEALAATKEIATSLFPASTTGWEQDECDPNRVVLVVNYNAGTSMDDEALYEKHERLLERFHEEVSEDARMGVSLERIID